MQKTSIEHPYDRNLNAEASWLRNVPRDTPIRLTWVLTDGEQVVLEDPLDRVERVTLELLLDRAEHRHGGVQVQLYQGAHLPEAPRRFVPLSEIAWIHLEVGR